jgi:pimeloyl-ACP methyl ester carboxylesterase
VLRQSLPLALALLGCPSTPPTDATTTTPAIEPVAEPNLEPVPTHLAGAILLPGNMTIDFLITSTADVAGKAESAKLWIPMQGVAGVDLDEVHHVGATLELGWKTVDARWVIEFGAKSGCEFRQQGQTLACTVEAVTEQEFAQRIEPPRPQTPIGPFPYAVELVKFANASAPEVTLAGTLTIPEGKGPHPALVLITGSGPQDRDETIVGHKPFAVLADHLSRRGIAVLRYDDRGVGESSGEFAQATMEDSATDAWAAVEFLRARPEIDPKRIGVLGHSEGALVGPAVAAAHPKQIAFVVMLAGTGVTGQEVITHQLRLIMKAGGASDELIARDAGYAERMYAAVLASPPGQARPALEPIVKEWYEGLEPDERQGVGGFEQALEQQVRPYETPWMRHFLGYDPAPTLAKLKMPVLAINGELDLQVDPDQNLPAIEKALKKNKRAKFVRLPGLNHLFQPATTGSPSEYGSIEITLDAAMLDQVASWVRAQAKLE